MTGGFLSGLGSLLQAGAAYIEHVNVANRAADGRPEDAPVLVTKYTRGLSDVSFNGFRGTLGMLIGGEGNAVRKARLQQVLVLADAARRGEELAPSGDSASASESVGGFDQDLALMTHWYEQLGEGEREAAVRQHVHGLTPQAYAGFVANLKQMQANVAERIRLHEASEGDGGSRFIEDRIAYRMARLQTGQRDPAYARQLAAYRGVQQFVEYLLRASEVFRTEREQQAPAAVAKAGPDAAAIKAALGEFARTGQYPGGAEQLQRDIMALVESGEADEALAMLKAMGANEGGNAPLDAAELYRPGEGLYELRWPLGVQLPMSFDELDRPTQFAVLLTEWNRRELEAGYALLHGHNADAWTIYEECLERAEQLDVPEVVARSHEGLAKVAFKNNQRSIERQHLKLAAAARESA